MKKRLVFTLISSILIFQILISNSVDAQFYPSSTWQTKTPTEMGMDINRLNELRDYVGGNGVVIRDGYLVYSWGSQSQRNDIASAVKPVYSHFMFEAVDSGLLTSIDQRINTFETCVNSINSNLNFKDRAITFKQMANQISCYGVRENPGTCFDYNDYNMALFFDTLFLGVYGATYSTVDNSVLNQRLGTILQFQDNPTFLGTGPNFQMGRMNISVRDFARFGLLYLGNGRWNSQQVIRQQDAIMAVTTPVPLSIPRTTAVEAQMCPGQRTIGSTTIPDDQTDHSGSYSFAWWVNGVGREGSRNWPRAPLDTYAALGLGATRSLVVMPGLDIVVAWNNPYRSSNVFVDRAFDYINRSAIVRDVSTPQENNHYLKDKDGNYKFFIGGYPFYPYSSFSPDGAAGDINWVENLEYNRVRGFNMVRALAVDGAWVVPPANHDYPFRRSNTCCAFDGGNKFDLSQINDAYFQSLDVALATAENKGQTVLIELFGVSGPFGCNPGQECYTNFSHNIYHSRNSINGANWINKSQARKDFFNPSGSLHAIQERLLNKYLDVVCRHPNIIHQPVNEIHRYTGMEFADQFEGWVRDKIRNPIYCRSNAVVLLNNEISNNFCIDRSGYQGITIHAPHRGNGAFPSGFSVNQMISTMSSLYGRNKFIGFDVDVGKIPLIDDYRRGAWTALTTGSGGFIVLYYQHRDISQSPRRGIVDADLPHLVNFLTIKQIRPWDMDPTRASLVRSGAATLLVKESSKIVLAYLRDGGTIQLDLGQFQGNLQVEWYNPREGTVDRTTSVNGGSITSFTPPSQTTSDWVLYISQSTQQRCSDGTLYNQCSSNQPLYCNNNGQLIQACGLPYYCGCPSPQTCQSNGACQGTPNQPPIATITQPTQTTFTVNSTINYAGTGSDNEEGNIPGNNLCWSYDITNDQQGFISLGCRSSGSFIPIQTGTYILKLVASDSQGLSGSVNKTLTINSNQTQTCNDGTPNFQCSGTKPLFCRSGVLEPRCFQCDCPIEGQVCDQIHGTCSGGTANISIFNINEQPVTVFDLNMIINYAGTVSDPNGPIPDSQVTWAYDIIGDNLGPFSLGIGRSGSFIANISIGPITLYRLRFTANDGQFTNFSEKDIIVLSESVPAGCQLTNAQWSTTNVEEGTLVNLIVNGNNCNGKLLNFVVWEDDALDGDDPVQVNPQSVTFNNNVATGSWIAEFQEDCGGSCNPPEYIFIASLNENSNINIQSSNQLIVNEGVTNLPPNVTIEVPRVGQQYLVNEPLTYSGSAVDSEDGALQGNSLIWRYDIIGDNQGFIALGNGQMGTFTPVFLINNSQTTYRFELTAFDSSNLSSSMFVEVQVNPAINPPPQQCSDGTLYNQCSSNQPLYCNSNGQLIQACGLPYYCGCPSPQICQTNGTCQRGPNQPPIATITQPTQTTFTVNTTINYAGTGSDPEEGNLSRHRLRWILNISGVAPYINLGTGESGSFIANVLRNNQPTLYTLKLVASDSQDASGSSTRSFTVVPINQTQQNLTEKHWLETEYASLGLPMSVFNDTQASNGRYIGAYVSDGYGQLQFTITNSGTYYLWMRTKWDGGNSNSLFVSIDNQPEIGFGNDYTVNEWHWVNSFQIHEVPEIVSLQLNAGQHSIRIRGRESGGFFGVDKILLTNNPAFVPTGVGDLAENLPAQQRILFFDNFEGYSLGSIPPTWTSNAGTWQVVTDNTNSYEGYMGAGNAYSYPNNQTHLTFVNYNFESKFKLLNSSTGIGFIGYHNSGRAYQVRYRTYPSQIFIEEITNFNGELGQDLNLINYSLQKEIWYKLRMEVETQTSKTVVRVKMWKETENEPSAWLMSYDDTRLNRLQQGGIGLVGRHLANRFDDVRVTSLSQQSPKSTGSLFSRILKILTFDRA